MARNEQLIRQLRLVQILENSRYGMTLAELARAAVEDLGLEQISERTIRRDLEALQAAGFDVAGEPTVERGLVWKLGERLRKPPHIAASATELLALSMGRELLTPLAGTPFGIGIESLWNKMRDSLPESVWKHFAQQRAHIVVRGGPAKSYGEKKGVVATLNRAILQHRVVEIEYRSAKGAEAKRREIHPYMMVLYRGSLYVVAAAAEDPPDRPLRHWKLDRFEKADALDRRFRPRADFDPNRHFDGSLGVYKAGKTVDAVVRIAPEAALWVEENPWSATQELARGPDGGVTLTLRDVYETEITPRVLALGAAAEVVAPREFRAKVRDLLDAMRRPYERGE
jgi:predicted DNA-binding transcriptional regulator YafY